MSFGYKVRRTRCHIGMTQSELAKRTGLTINKIEKIEHNRSFPANLFVVKKFAEALSVRTSVLFNYSDLLIMEAGQKGGLKKQRTFYFFITKFMRDMPVLPKFEERAFLSAVNDSFWRCVEESKKRYTPYKYRKPDPSLQTN